MAKLEVHQFPTRSDNYGVLLHDPETEATAAIDAPDAEERLAALHEKGWKVPHILTTHHHHDHTAGNAIVKRMTGCNIVGPAKEACSIPGIDIEVKEGDSVDIGGVKGKVIETPGHTKGHVSYYFPESGIVCVGDTLFSVSCGKLLEGDAKMMWSSLKKLMALPPATALYCGHEYTNNNCRFALTVEPENEALRARAAEAAALAEQGEPALPTTIAQELATNPFLRPSSAISRSGSAWRGGSCTRSSARSASARTSSSLRRDSPARRVAGGHQSQRGGEIDRIAGSCETSSSTPANNESGGKVWTVSADMHPRPWRCCASSPPCSSSNTAPPSCLASLPRWAAPVKVCLRSY